MSRRESYLTFFLTKRTLTRAFISAWGRRNISLQNQYATLVTRIKHENHEINEKVLFLCLVLYTLSEGLIFVGANIRKGLYAEEDLRFN